MNEFLFRRKLLAEVVEDERVAMEIARLEEEFRRLTEENRTLVTVHNERAQQLKSLCLTNGTRRDSSWPLTSADPETLERPAGRQAMKPCRNKGSASAPSQQQSVNQLIAQKKHSLFQTESFFWNYRLTVIIGARLW